MKLVVFGLTVSSSWGNGHATIWRGLCGALARQGHEVEFFERDVPYYALHRDLKASDSYDLILYPCWEEVAARARRALEDADCARFVEHLAAADHCTAVPPVDLLIRTGGEKRLSDFLLWESAYAELYFVDCCWPDFDEQAFAAALEEYSRRDRRFGLVAPQLARSSHG